MKDAKVNLWGSPIGAVTWDEEREVGVFQYDADFLRSGIQLSPLMMPLSDFPISFPALARETFYGLPGLLADSLPDKFGHTLIDAWLAGQGRTPASFNPVERLCYIGRRGMGGLEFEPAIFGPASAAREIEVASLVVLINKVLDQRAGVAGVLSGDDDREVIENILRVGTSAGGARAKAVLAWNPSTQSFRSGQLDLPAGYEHWMMKFDGISKNRDKELADPLGYGRIEYAYHLMARAAGIEMSECRLHHEGGRSHFMTRRFDRTPDGQKLHMQSLGAMAHYDYNQPASHSYEQALQVMKRLGLPQQALEEQVLRALFNVAASNQDDHVKNIAFLMDRSGEWRLSPAFDLTYAYDPMGAWTSQHQMSIHGKRERFERGDLFAMAAMGGLKKRRAAELLAHVVETVKDWPDFAAQAGVDEARMRQIQATHRLVFAH
jgi:serine/threonine-protein kinase HipA